MFWRVLCLPGPLSVRSCLGSHGYQDMLVSEVGAYEGSRPVDGIGCEVAMGRGERQQQKRP